MVEATLSGNTIHVLTLDTAAKLAAGEVIERPASAVRELVDNSLDAGATRVTVAVSQGGVDLIQVVDDGVGVSPEDLRVCTARHATSKLSNIADLASISSLGFRGEALHSIAAVARLRIRSRRAGQPGHEVRFEALDLVEDGPAGGVEGTQVEVRDLFYNTPARLKFLRGPSAEAARVSQLVRRYALARPDVSFRLLVNNKEQFRSPGGELTDALAALYGWRTVESLLRIEGEQPGEAIVSGYVGPPKMFRTSRSEINIFVNGRWVQPRSLLWSVQEAYSSLLMVGRHPIAALHVQVPPERLDVNVHPAKSEVRFANERAVTSLVGRTVRAALLGDSDSATSEDAPPVEIRQFELSSGEPARESAQWESPTQESWPIPTPHSVRDEADEPTALPPLRILGQMGATYIIAEGPAGMCLIDQHAAHERILLERFQAGVRVGELESQALLEPTVIPLTRDQASRAEELAAEIGALGFSVEAFGGDSLLVRSLPAGIPAERVEEVLTSLEEGVEGLDSIEERRRAMLASMACHAAIKAGQVLDMREMRALIADLERTRAPLACAHGRPTILELSRSDLEREFGRRGAISQSRRA